MGPKNDAGHESAHHLNNWLADNRPAWATKIRAIYGDQADDVLEIILGDAA